MPLKMSPKKNANAKSPSKESKEIAGIFSDIKIDVNALDGTYNKGNTIAHDETSLYKPYTIFGNGEFPGGSASDRGSRSSKISLSRRQFNIPGKQNAPGCGKI